MKTSTALSVLHKVMMMMMMMMMMTAPEGMLIWSFKMHRVMSTTTSYESSGSHQSQHQSGTGTR
jgi:hypothetical protein